MRSPCQLSSVISAHVWKNVITKHSVGIEASEIGVTSDIMTEILLYCQKSGDTRIKVLKSIDEHASGSDFFLFLENPQYNGHYYIVALQAKVLHTSETYRTLKDGYATGGRYQWEKLKEFELTEKSIAYYLLYNGVADFIPKNTDCKGKYPPAQLGCTLVRPDEIQFIYHTISHQPHFTDIHEKYARPWRELFCCSGRPFFNPYYFLKYGVRADIKHYSIPELHRKYPKFYRISETIQKRIENVKEDLSTNPIFNPMYAIVLTHNPEVPTMSTFIDW